MLTESDVIKAVCDFLEGKGYKILQQLKESEKGDDIIAVSADGRERVFIEAKGETSSRKTSAIYGKPFSRGQVRVHVAEAFYRAAQKLENDGVNSISAGIALPDNQDHTEMVGRIKRALEILHIEVFWVSSEGLVEVEGIWEIGTDRLEERESKYEIQARDNTDSTG